MFSTSFYPTAFQYSPSFGSGFHYPSPPSQPPHFEQFCPSGHAPPHGFGGPFSPPPFVGPGFTYGLPVPPPPPFHARSPLGVHQLPPFFHGTFMPYRPSPHHSHPHHGPGPHHGPDFSHPSPPPPGSTMRDETADMPGDHQEDDGAVRSGIAPPLSPSVQERQDESRSGLHGGSGKPRERELDPTSSAPPPPGHGPNLPGEMSISGGPPHPHGSKGRHRTPLPRPIHGPAGPGGPPPPPDHPRPPPTPPLSHEFPRSCQHLGCYFPWSTWPPSSPHRGPFQHSPQFAFTGCEGPHQPAFNTSPFGQSCSCQFWDHPDQFSFNLPHPPSGYHHRDHRRGGAFRGRRHRGPVQGHRWEWRALPGLESESESASDSTIEDREEDQAEMKLPNEVPRGYETTDQSGRATGREDDWEGVEVDERVSPTILARSVEEGKAIGD